MTLENVGWWIMAVIAVGCALGMVTARNPVHSALWLVANLVSLAVIYLILSAPVLFAIQMIVYAGAIMVLFLFVIMFFMAPGMRQWLRPPLKSQLVLGGVLVVAFVVMLLGAFAGTDTLAPLEAERPALQTPQQQGGPPAQAPGGAQTGTPAQPAGAEEQIGVPRKLGLFMFRYHTLPFELTSLLLLAALLGAVMVARDVHGEGREHAEEHAPVAQHDAGGEVAR